MWKLSWKLALEQSTLVDIARAGHFSFDLCPQSAELCVLTVHQEAALNQRPSLTELLLPIVLQRPPSETLGQTKPPQTGLHALNGLVPVELQGLGEVLQSGSLSGAQHQAATSPTQILRPDMSVIRAAGVGASVFLDDFVQIGHGPLV